jgi:hypothetical protein
MPSTTERQQAAEALHQAFLLNLIAEAEADLLQSDSSTSSGSSDSSLSSDSESDDEAPPSVSEDMLHSMANLYSQHYYNVHKPIPKTAINMQILLNDYKFNQPEIFQSYLQITPSCFDDLVTIIHDDEIFLNNSNNDQMPVEEQVVIALYRFGHYGNAASTMKVALWVGYGYGTVRLATKRVMAATCSERFRHSAIRWSSDEAKEVEKAWVEEQSCPVW